MIHNRLSKLSSPRTLIALLTATILVAAASVLYAVRARESAIRGWGEATSLSKRLETAEAKSDTTRISKRLSEYDLALKWLIMEEAGIRETASEREIGETLTRHLYSETSFSGEYINTDNNPLRFFLTTRQKSFNYCSSLSATLTWELKLFGIESRIVNVAAESFFSSERGDTHTFVEANIDGETIVLDPTFDATYACGSGSGPIDARSMFECVQAGQSLTPNYLSPPRPKRSLADYYIALDKLFYAIDARDGSERGFYHLERPYVGWLRDTQQKWAEGRLPLLIKSTTTERAPQDG